MKVLVTGANGFIGRQAIASLEGESSEVHAVSSGPVATVSKVAWHTADLLDLDQCSRLIEAVRPTHLLHLAWNAVPGVYWTTLDNLRWVQSSLQLLQAFIACGGERVIMSGTCAEYDWSHPLFIEDPLTVRYSEAWLELKRSTRVPLLAGEKNTAYACLGIA